MVVAGVGDILVVVGVGDIFEEEGSRNEGVLEGLEWGWVGGFSEGGPMSGGGLWTGELNEWTGGLTGGRWAGELKRGIGVTEHLRGERWMEELGGEEQTGELRG